MSIKRVSLSLCTLALFSTVAKAHSGHGDPSNGFVHYVTSPIHVAPLLFGAVLAAAIAIAAIRNRRFSPVQVKRS
jgi:hypothetical protein